MVVENDFVFPTSKCVLRCDVGVNTERYIGNRLVLISHDEEGLGVLETLPNRVEKEPMSKTSTAAAAMLPRDIKIRQLNVCVCVCEVKFKGECNGMRVCVCVYKCA